MNYKDYPVHKANPFLAGLSIKKGTKAVGMGEARHMVDSEGVVSNVDVRMVIRKPVEKASFVKLYPSEKLFKISPISLKLLLYMITKSSFGNAGVQFDPREWMSEEKRGIGLCHSPKTVYASLRELLAEGLIAKAEGNCEFYINPQVGFRGNRLDLLK